MSSQWPIAADELAAWGRKPAWTIQECAFLMARIGPNWMSQFAVFPADRQRQISGVLDLLERAVAIGEIREKERPFELLAYLCGQGITVARDIAIDAEIAIDVPASNHSTTGCAVNTAASPLQEPPDSWSKGLRSVAWAAACSIVAGNSDITANGLEFAMLQSGRADLVDNEIQMRSVDTNLTDRQMRAKAKTIAGWATQLKKILVS